VTGQSEVIHMRDNAQTVQVDLLLKAGRQMSGNPTYQELTMKCAKFGFHPPILILADSRSAPRTPN